VPTAFNAVKLMLGCYPAFPPRDEETYCTQMAIALEGVDIDILKELVHPRMGILLTCPKYLPGVGEVVDWVQYRLTQRNREIEFNRALIADAERADTEPQVSPEEKARVLAKVDAYLARLRSCDRAGRKAYKPGDSLSPEENAKLDAWIADPRTPSLPQAKPVGSFTKP